MSGFVNLMVRFNNLVWSMPLVFLCAAAGIYFTIRLRGGQFRLLGEMIRLLKGEGQEMREDGISPFQAFAATVGSRVGMGNIAGVAAAIFFGGPGAVFWMWFIALFGAASAFAESALAQAYKNRENGEFIGGPQLFILKGLKLKPLAILFAVSTVLAPGILMPGVQVQAIVSTFNNAFGTNDLIVGILCTVAIGLVVWGGIKRIGKVAEFMAPFMCIVYILMALAVLVMHIRELPSILWMIISSAFGINQLFGGLIGSAISWGVKRGVYSNEAGQGSGAIVSAAADCNHPAEQGLIQALSVYIDTILVCTASAVIILMTGNYSVQATDGVTMLVNNTDTTYGILWAQDAINMAFGGTWGGKLLAIMVVLFVFTSLMGYYYQAESTMRFLCRGKPIGTWIMRILFLIAVFAGVVVKGTEVWSMADLGVGLMAWFNIISILLLSNKAAALLKDYEDQKKAGKKPLFDPAKFGIEDATGAWSRTAAELRKREGR